MIIVELLIVIFLAGSVGGVVNALMSDNGFVLPRSERSGGVTIIRPGYIGNIIMGGVAAAISWGLYGPLASYFIMGTPGALAHNPTQDLGLTLSSFVGAALVGVGGARWLTNEVDKNLLRVAASNAAAAQPKPEVSAQIALASPAQAFSIAKQLVE